MLTQSSEQHPAAAMTPASQLTMAETSPILDSGVLNSQEKHHVKTTLNYWDDPGACGASSADVGAAGARRRAVLGAEALHSPRSALVAGRTPDYCRLEHVVEWACMHS
jgi:hypothetical protein